ncbi:hypothetical protein C8034_v007670 [Colletotrichum sidae]|uniref:Uncharacterized protein n=2 Tax=Colletotrichum orbiculare species complex TaxID=2707354 RepID=A0A4R8QFD4_9PEZI|nr:hypothetical protein C8035_v012186 [Colletotrichum spinosum]TEA11388.1 hypothetical protein C8034_v007670 [Colletotrichum sidae]
MANEDLKTSTERMEGKTYRPHPRKAFEDARPNLSSDVFSVEGKKHNTSSIPIVGEGRLNAPGHLRLARGSDSDSVSSMSSTFSNTRADGVKALFANPAEVLSQWFDEFRIVVLQQSGIPPTANEVYEFMSIAWKGMPRRADGKIDYRVYQNGLSKLVTRLRWEVSTFKWTGVDQRRFDTLCTKLSQEGVMDVPDHKLFFR